MEPTFTLWLWRNNRHVSLAHGETLGTLERIPPLMAGQYPADRFLILPDGVMPSVCGVHHA